MTRVTQPLRATNQRKGTSFEQKVAFLYRSMGFLVVTDVRLSGQQFDLIAEKHIAGGAQIRMAVECKYLSRGKVSNQHILDFKSTFNALRDQQNLTHGTIVTNADFSADAKSILDGSSVLSHKTLAQLEDDTLGLPASYFEFTRRYERSRIFDSYIDLEAHGSLPGSDKEEMHFTSIEASVMDWIDTSDPGFLSVHGDFGSGKTTLLQRIKYLCCQKYIAGDPISKPLWLQLRDFKRSIDLQDFITACIRLETGRQVPAELIWNVIESGDALLLLDGFDEIATGADRDARAQFFYDLAPLIQSNSKSIMTCRPAYFVSTDEYNSLLDRVENDTFGESRFFVMHESRRFSDNLAQHNTVRQTLRNRYLGIQRHPLTTVATGTVRLALLDDRQIDSYLALHDGKLKREQRLGWREVKNFLLSIYDIKDLMTRPLLLDMVVEVLLNGKINLASEAATIGPSSLYENYTEMHFAIDWDKGSSRQFLTTEERRLFAQAVAWAMFRKGSIEVAYEDILGVVQANKHVLARLKDKVTIHNLGEVVADIQICAFLTRVGKQGFRFVHKSFMEFFVARYIKGVIEEDKQDSFFDNTIPYEILYFLGGFGLFEARFMAKVEHRIRNHSHRRPERFRRNLTGIQMYSAHEFRARRFSDVY